MATATNRTKWGCAGTIESACGHCGNVIRRKDWAGLPVRKQWFCDRRCYYASRASGFATMAATTKTAIQRAGGKAAALTIRARNAATAVNRFWSKVDKSVWPGGCWIWTAGRHGGYGSVRIAGRACRAHRVSYELSIGPIPDGLVVMHRCDNPPCVNPAHLSLGTIADNNADAVAKGRQDYSANGRRSNEVRRARLAQVGKGDVSHGA